MSINNGVAYSRRLSKLLCKTYITSTTNNVTNRYFILFPFVFFCDCDSHVYHQYTLRIIDADRDALVKYLNEKNIPCGVYYPIPLHLQKAYTSDRYNEADFEITNQVVNEVISLPMHTELTDDQIELVTHEIKTFFT